MPSTLDAVESVLRQHAEGRATNRARRRVALPTGGLNYMAAGAPEIGALGLKAYTVARTGARFYTLLFDPEGGELLSIMQSDRLGQVRTGAASGVATKHLAREDANTLGIYGAGWQAESQLEAIAAVRDLDRVIVYSRSEDSREELGLEAGDLMQSLETGAILPEAVYELGQVIAGQVPGRSGPEDITLFASQGLALEDMAAARVVYDRAVERDVGRDIDLWGEGAQVAGPRTAPTGSVAVSGAVADDRSALRVPRFAVLGV